MLLFCTGVLLAGLTPRLPETWVLLIPTGAAAFCLWRRLCIPIVVFLLGIVYGLICGQLLVDQQLNRELDGREFLVVGTVADLPVNRTRLQRFQFSIESASLFDASATSSVDIDVPSTVLISWYNQHELRVGQRWQLVLKLRRPRGFVNEGGFDYQRWLLSRGVGATGYVRETAATNKLNQRIEDSHAVALLLPTWRQKIRDWLSQGIQNDAIDANSHASALGPLLALAIGDNSQINEAQWQVFQSTGTSHLMAISGLHIGLVALFGYWWGHGVRAVASFITPRAHFFYYLPGVFSIVMAAYYAAIAGFALPTQRALSMVCVVNIAMLLSKQISLARLLTYALLVVVLIDPLAGFEPGFWLSFGAVAMLCWSFHGRYRIATSRSNDELAGNGDNGVLARITNYLSNRCKNVLVFSRSQWVVFIGLLLPLFALNLSPSLIAPLANLIAIPLMSFAVVLPMLLAVMVMNVSDAIAQPLFSIAQFSMHYLLVWLEFLSDWQQQHVSGIATQWLPGVPSMVALLIGMAGVLLLLAPKGVPGRYLGALLLLPALLNHTTFAPNAQADARLPPLQLTVLDVGQGLAVVVRTGNSTLVYDAGPEFSERFNAGDAIVGNYLRYQGIKVIDTLVVSHADTDHAGGVAALVDEVPVKQVLVGEELPTPIKQATHSCRTTSPWQINDVYFRFISLPTTANAKLFSNNNNRSCVLLIEWRGHTILLPGDIEKEIEQQLLLEKLLPKQVDVVVAPHHGSLTSSSEAFVRHISAQLVVFSAGYENRYGHPHPKVVERYQKMGTTLVATAASGQIDIEWFDEHSEPQVKRWRQQQQRYWYW